MNILPGNYFIFLFGGFEVAKLVTLRHAQGNVFLIFVCVISQIIYIKEQANLRKIIVFLFLFFHFLRILLLIRNGERWRSNGLK